MSILGAMASSPCAPKRIYSHLNNLKRINGGRICISYQEIIMISFVVGNAKPAIQSGEINVEIVVNTCPNDELFLHPSFS